MNTATIAQHYSEDHDRLDDLFRLFQTLKQTDRPSALAAFQEFKAGLERHIVWEEKILFPAFERKTGLEGGPTEVMRSEHRQIRGFLAAIADKLARSDGETADDETGLLAVLGPHNQKEEGILYPMIDQVTDAGEQAEMFSEMSKRTDGTKEPMHRIEGVYREVIEKSEWLAIATSGPDGPHLAACWTRHVLTLGLDGDEILIPAWRYETTAQNLQRDPRVELLFVARDVPHTEGQGQGCTVVGRGELQTAGPTADRVKAQFPWARSVLVVQVDELKTHLP